MSSHSSSVKSPWVDLQVVDMEPSAFPISQAYGIWQPDGWQLCHSSGYIFTTASYNEFNALGPQMLVLHRQLGVGRLPVGLGMGCVGRNSLRYARRCPRWWTVPLQGVNSYGYRLYDAKARTRRSKPAAPVDEAQAAK